MSTRHRWLAVYFALTAGLVFLIPRSPAGQTESSQPVGEVGLRELTALALQNDPKLVELRHRIPIEEAKKRAARQWRDPEIRIGFSKDDNIQLDQPYTRSGTVSETIGGASGGNETGGRNGPTAESSNSVERRTTTYHERVTPGEDSDRIQRVETERRTTNSATSTTDDRGTLNERETETETFRSAYDETRFDSRDRFARDQTTSAKIRFWIPKPWEMKARVAQAAKEIDLANYEVVAAEREVILKVREEYEKLQYLHKKLQTAQSKIAIIQKHVDNEKALLDAGAEFTLDQLSFEDIKIPGLELASDADRMELEAAKRELAARVGLQDGSRIRVTDKLLRSTINLQGTDLDYLTRMAYVHRGEVGILKHEQAIAESELDLVQSERIPWFSFIEAAYAKDSTGGNHTNDNYGVQFGVVLPLFSWLAKDEKVVEARIESYYASLEANKRNIANEVAEAFQSVKEAARYRSRAESAIAQHGRKLQARVNSLDGSDDLAAKENLRYDIEIERDEFRQYLLTADRLYNQSLIRLEQALGADLDQVFAYEVEALAGAAAGATTTEVLAAAAPAPLEAKATATKIELPSDGESPSAATAKPKRKGLLSRFKNPGAKKIRKPGARR